MHISYLNVLCFVIKKRTYMPKNLSKIYNILYKKDDSYDPQLYK